MQALSSSDAPAIDASISSLFREKTYLNYLYGALSKTTDV